MESKPNILMQRYELGRLLGQGTFGKVYYGRSAITNQSVAIKMIDKDKIMRTGQVEQIRREISVMRLARHPNIIQLFEVMANKSKIYFVMEYAKGGELFNKVAKGKLKEDVAHKYFKQLINAVDYCHSRGVFHRDIKPENILLDENGNLKVSDFGLSALVESKRQDGLLHTPCGTPAYVAPEVIKRKGYDGTKADIWSCGIVLFVLLAGYLPFHDPNLIEMYRKISKAELKCPNWFPPDVCKLLGMMLDPNPDTRIPISIIREHCWFKKEPNVKNKRPVVENNTVSSSGTVLPDQNDCCDGLAAEANGESVAPLSINAFDIISRSAGFDLSRFFDDSFRKKEARFSSRLPANVIISKLEDIAKQLRMKIKKRAGGLLKLEGLEEGRKGVLTIDAEIFEVTPCFHLVEVKKSNGDTLEYQKILKEDIRPALQDIVWVWQSDQQLQSQPSEQELQQTDDQQQQQSQS
ncbi:CBL-interacting serine/threonine-protein kinase 10 [Vigna radiata var. radiata]|uniref:non-specific serine/threonine protein kinase n=1 Tax=Vigna radiata var. radiata TaxID=3916 RepID=A0A1S3T7C0_VIGRR|nr:CBL-interacting serine/threonine-protein kinase 10 [Vigna radiata var. radiata]XP_014489664.1 CBL-interacting serine/threonine-protein kinase 10 [Vigna radiata var. radiata]XP_022632848.1 CBL-interacting serine/threonine-protein kinase 10 [Vigna radiata var. radiata]